MAKRQAVVMIHGIGEQRPMRTLRAFVEAVWEDDNTVHADPLDEDGGMVWSTPDDISGSFELRRITTTQNAAGVRTDFYEFYWAHLMDEASMWDIKPWLSKLVHRNAARTPRHMAQVRRWLGVFYRAAWALALLTGPALFFILALISREWPVWLWSVGIGGGVLFVAASLFAAARPAVRKVVGDAARYLEPNPPNIKARSEIRQAGLDLLTRLHEAKDNGGGPRYERIVVVGHSLGTVIGYDVLNHYWSHVNKQIEVRRTEVLNKLEEAAFRLTQWEKALLYKDAVCALYPFSRRVGHRDGIEPFDYTCSGTPMISPEDKDLGLKHAREEFWACQELYFNELLSMDAPGLTRNVDPDGDQKPDPSPWRISDFITLGSPLTHASFLIVDDRKIDEKRTRLQVAEPIEEGNFRPTHHQLVRAQRCRRNWPTNEVLEAMKNDGEMPTCPPEPRKKGLLYRSSTDDRLYLHHAAHFAITRWTNIYFPNRTVLDGDVISGPLAPVLGLGIRDIPADPRWVKRRKAVGITHRICHLDYWTYGGDEKFDGDKVHAAPNYLVALRRALRLDWSPPPGAS